MTEVRDFGESRQSIQLLMGKEDLTHVTKVFLGIYNF